MATRKCTFAGNACEQPATHVLTLMLCAEFNCDGHDYCEYHAGLHMAQSPGAKQEAIS